MASAYDPPLTPIIDTATGTLTEIGRIFLRTLGAAVGALAPLNARYWLSTTDPTLTNEQNIGSLATGYLKITTAVGVATPSTVSAVPQADVTGLVAALAAKAPLASPALTGTPTAPTAAGGTNTTQIATTAFVQGDLPAKAPLASPALTGTPTAPTAAPATNSTQIATTAYADAAIVAERSATATETNKRITARVTTIVSNATPTVNTDDCDAVTITALAAAITSMTTNLSGTPTNFQRLIYRIKDDGTGRAIAWGASFEAAGVALPTTTVAGKLLTVGFLYNSVTSKFGCVASAQEA